VDSSARQGRDSEGVPALAVHGILADPESFRLASVAAQRLAIEGLDPTQIEPWLRLLEADPRKGRRQLASRLRNAAAKRERVEARWRCLADFDRETAGGLLMAGVDEVGRGPLAGPVTAAALILPPDYHAPGLDDSKRMRPEAREEWATRLREEALAWAVADLPAEEIDRIGIRKAVFAVMGQALRELSPRAERVLIDGNELPPGARISRAVVGGDARSLSIAGASVLAKVHRDALMVAADERWPGYGFAGHKGYGSAAHVAALLEQGPCPLHRRSFCGRWLGEAKKHGGDRRSR
jgi:ribonuclease HII